jgi:hypothetical protein
MITTISTLQSTPGSEPFFSFPIWFLTFYEQTHKIFSFHPATAKLHGIEVKAPWDRQDVLFPPPHPAFLELHYFTSISRNMKGSGDNEELDNDDEDYEELSELEILASQLQGNKSG